MSDGVDVIIGLLEGALDGQNSDRRQQAEAEIQRLSGRAGFAISLLRFALSSTTVGGSGSGEEGGELYSRQLKQFAMVQLKNVIDCHWSKLNKRYRGGELIGAEEKKQLRQELPRGLRHPVAIIRNATAQALATIAVWDWPTHWPSFLPDLLNALQLPSGGGGGDINVPLIQGALRCLSLFTQSGKLSDQQLPKLVPLVAPVLLRFYQADDRVIPKRIRIQVFPILSSCIAGILMVRGSFKKPADALLKKLVAAWMPHFVAVLAAKDTAQQVECPEKIYVLTALQYLFTDWTQAMVPLLPKLLPPIFSSIVSCSALYQQAAVDDDLLQEAPTDEEGNVLGFEMLVVSLLDFLRLIIEHKTLRKALAHNLPHIVFYAVGYLQITIDEEQRWQHDLDEFLADEEDWDMSNSVRSTAALLLTELFSFALRDSTIPNLAQALTSAVTRHYSLLFSDSSSSSSPSSSSSSSSSLSTMSQPRGKNAWKILEAMIYAIGFLSTELLQANRLTGKKIFDLAWTFKQLLLPAIHKKDNFPTSFFLRARALWATGLLSDQIPKDNVVPLFQTAVSVFSNEAEKAPLRLAVCLALKGFLPKLDEALVRPMLPRLVPSLCRLLGQETGNPLHLLFGTLLQAILVPQGADDSNFFFKSLEPIVKAILRVWSRFFNDPDIAEDIMFVFQALARSSPGVCRRLHALLHATLTGILGQHPDKMPALSCSALDVLEVVMAPAEAPLAAPMIGQLFFNVVRLGMTSLDSAILQNVALVLGAYVHAGGPQLAEAKFMGGKSSGIALISQFLHRMLTHADVPEMSLTQLDTPLIQLLTGSGLLPPAMQQTMLKTVFKRMVTSKIGSVREALLFVFVRLLCASAEATISFLTQMTDPKGKQALEYFLPTWMKSHEDLLGHYRQKVSCIAMVSLLKSASSLSVSVAKITVPGQLLVDLKEGRTTRSKKTITPRYSQIPIPAKIVKILIGEHQSLVQPEDEMSDPDDFSDEDAGDSSDDDGGRYRNRGDSDDDDFDDDGTRRRPFSSAAPGGSPFAPAEDYNLDDEDEAEDVSAQLDPLNDVNLVEFLTNNLKTIYANSALQSICAPHLSPHEREYISKFGQ